jgi:hypothetical protein
MKILPALLLLLLGLAACGGDFASGERNGSEEQEPAVPSASAPGMELRRGRAPRELAWIGLRGALIGPEGGPLAWKLFVDPRRADDAWSFLQVYAPFEMKSAKGDLVFRGRGRTKPGAAERRMILEWARLTATEAAEGRGASAYGLVLASHQAGAVGLCEDVAVFLSGEAVATACGWDREVRGRLHPGSLARVYGWFDRLQPFQTGIDEGEERLRSGQLQTRLVFAGRGARFSAPAEEAEIRSFATALFAELAAQRRGAAAAGEPPPARLLLAAGGVVRTQEVVLELPERAPPVPRRERTLTPGPSPVPSRPPAPGEGSSAP